MSNPQWITDVLRDLGDSSEAIKAAICELSEAPWAEGAQAFVQDVGGRVNIYVVSPGLFHVFSGVRDPVHDPTGVDAPAESLCTYSRQQLGPSVTYQLSVTRTRTPLGEYQLGYRWRFEGPDTASFPELRWPAPAGAHSSADPRTFARALAAEVDRLAVPRVLRDLARPAGLAEPPQALP